ncbi:MAG: MarR family winged helix-turn-helix transcriptional regulator [Casimicrobiaceae bacterium]
MSVLRSILQRNEIAFIYRIGYLFNQFSGPVYKRTEDELGIQRPQFATLFCVAHLPGLSASDIVLLTGTPKNSVSRAVSMLRHEGMIRSVADPGDGRRAALHLTAKGRRVYAQILPLFQERQAKLLQVLTPSEQRTFDALLTKLVDRDDGWAQAL